MTYLVFQIIRILTLYTQIIILINDFVFQTVFDTIWLATITYLVFQIKLILALYAQIFILINDFAFQTVFDTF
jgi:hypothetical protein